MDPAGPFGESSRVHGAFRAFALPTGMRCRKLPAGRDEIALGDPCQAATETGKAP